MSDPSPLRPRDVRGECGSWRPGELAVCIGRRWAAPCPHTPARGEVLRVTHVMEFTACGVHAVGLVFEAKPIAICWDARGFRKPVRDDQPASADFHLPAPRPAPVPA